MVSAMELAEASVRIAAEARRRNEAGGGSRPIQSMVTRTLSMSMAVPAALASARALVVVASVVMPLILAWSHPGVRESTHLPSARPWVRHPHRREDIVVEAMGGESSA
jgi:hypothetical protein